VSKFCIVLQRLDEFMEDMTVTVKAGTPWSAAQLAKGEVKRLFPGSNWRVKSWRRLNIKKAVNVSD